MYLLDGTRVSHLIGSTGIGSLIVLVSPFCVCVVFSCLMASDVRGSTPRLGDLRAARENGGYRIIISSPA